jgi:ribose 5-phosphate isomerase A
VEILRFGASRTLERLRDLGLRPRLRMAGDRPYATDNGNLLADCPIEDRIDAVALDRALHAIAGVVETGLFTFGVERALLGHEDGGVRTFEGDVASRAGVGPVVATVAPFVRPPEAKPILLLMGVSGSGKTTIGVLLAQLLGVRFRDGDDLHPEANVRKMHAGHPLDDDDRLPWLHRIRAELADWSANGTGGVLVASMLKRRYRDLVLRSPLGFSGETPRLVHLIGDRDILAGRLQARRGHFMPSGLLDSQFAALEAPGADEDAVPVSVDGTPGEAALSALRQIGAV